MASSLNELKDPNFYRAVVAEALGTAFLVFIGCGSCIDALWSENKSTNVQIALGFGLTVATVVWCIGHVSGGHINPAVTVGMLVARKISILRAVVYVMAQCAGALVGAGLLNFLTPHKVEGKMGVTEVHEPLTVGQGFGVELLITFLLVFTVFASCDSNRSDLKGSAPLTIGLSVTICHLFAMQYTGSSMNPARTFGPAVVKSIWKDHWVYWCGPLCGGVIAALLYEMVFAADASLKKARYFFLSRRAADQAGQSVGLVETQASPEERTKMMEAEKRPSGRVEKQASPEEPAKLMYAENLPIGHVEKQALPEEPAKLVYAENLPIGHVEKQASPEEPAKLMYAENLPSGHVEKQASPDKRANKAESKKRESKKRESEKRTNVYDKRPLSPEKRAKKIESEK